MKAFGPAGPLSAYFFFQKAAFAFLMSIFTSMFLKEYGASGLPWYYVGHTVFFILVQLGIMNLTSLSGRSILVRMLPFLVVSIFFLAFFSSVVPPWLIFITLIISKSSETLATQSFFDLSGQILPVREAKKRLPGILAVGMIGSVIAGLSLRFLMGEGLMGVFLVITAVVFAVSFYLLPDSSDSVESVEPGKAETKGKKITGLAGVASTTRKYVWIVVAMSAAGTFTCSLIDFLFSGSLAIELQDSHKIAGFLGLFYAMVDLTVLTFQGLIGGWFFRKFSLGVLLSVRPVSLCFLSLAVWWNPIFMLVVASQFVMRISTSIFMSPSWVLLLEPLPSSPKIFARRLLNICDAVVTLIIGLGLLAYTRAGGGVDSGLYLMDAFLFAATLLLTGILVKLYPLMIKDTLAEAPSAERATAVAGTRFLPARERLRYLQTLMGSGDVEVRRSAITECCADINDDAMDILLTSLAQEEYAPNITLIIRALMSQRGADAGPALVELLHPKQEARLLADMLEAVGSCDFPELEKVSSTFLDSPHRRVRGAAIINILRHGHDRELLKRAVTRLYRETRDDDPANRATAALVIGRIALPAFLPALMELADDEHEKPSLKAFRALCRFRQPEVIEFLVRRSTLSGKRGKAAREALNEHASEERTSMMQLLKGLPGDERRRLGFWWQILGPEFDLKLVQRLLRLEDACLRDGLMQLLAEADLKTIELVRKSLFDENSVTRIRHELILEELEADSWQSLPAAAIVVPAIGLSGDVKVGEVILRRAADLCRKSCLARIAFPDKQRDDVIKGWKENLDVLLQVLALWTGDSGDWHDAMEKARSEDAFVNSVAQEFIDARLGNRFSRILLPLLDNNSSIQDMNEGLKQFGLSVDPEMQQESAALKLAEEELTAG